MKKLICILTAVLMSAALLTGCASDTAQAPTGDQTFKVAIVQQLDHSSLDEIRTAIAARLQELAQQQNVGLTIKEFNGQNDASTLNQIGSQVVADGFDLIIPIATTAAQCMVTAADGTGIPVVYSAISDPESAGLTGLPSVTGISDALNTQFILDMMLAVQPDVQTVGLLYSNSEINSATPIAEAKAYLESKGIAYLEKTGNSAPEIVEAASSLVGRVQAVFTPTDNAVMSAEAAVAEIFNNSGIAHYTGADSFVLTGAFAACGVNYTQLGNQTADLAFDILMGGQIPADFQKASGGIITVNTDAAQLLQLDTAPFAAMAQQVQEVTTADSGR